LYEIKRLVGRIESLLEADPAYHEIQENAARRNSLRQRLTELREEIRSAFPDTHHKRCLLRETFWNRSFRSAPEPERIGFGK
jgi:hypothetical protein